MDRNQIIGLVAIFAILIGYSVFMMPSSEERAKMQQKNDSIALAYKQQMILDSVAKFKQDSIQKATHSANKTIIGKDSLISDSAKTELMNNKFGIFANSAIGIEKFITLQNKQVKIKISTLGGFPKYTELREFKTHDSLPLILFNQNESEFSINFYENNKAISTGQMYFIPGSADSLIDAQTGIKTISMRLNAGANKYLEFVYTLEPNSYILKYKINIVGLENEISQNSGYLDLVWNAKSRRQEKGADWENQNTTIYYKYFGDEIGYLSETGDKEEEKLPTKVKWIAYKDQFFSTVFIANDYFASAEVKYEKDKLQNKYLKNFESSISLPYNKKPNESLNFSIYYGPNDYDILKNIEISNSEKLEMQELIPLGWTIFRWVNRFAVIPLFNLLGSFFTNFGLIILLMTIIIKTVLFPLTYKSFLSSAKMRVLKPQIDAINEKIPKEKTMERQQETMKLYKKVGVNPMGGCLPMLLQFPFLIAMYRFFPASIELRQKSFLWANDLSAFDSIWTFPGGFSIPMYGDHVSLFALLMAVAMLISSLMNGSQMASSNSQVPGMKLMLYLMPVMMVLWFNNYSAGLSYYYLLSNLITIGQTVIIRRMVDENKLLTQLNAKKGKPEKKSRFAMKMEELQKRQKAISQKKK